MSRPLRLKLGLCQECQRIKQLAINSIKIIDGKVTATRICWECMRKAVKQ